MPNVQQPEMRRSGKDPLVQDSAENVTDGQGSVRGGSGKPETVRRVNLFNHHALLSQLTELKNRKY